MVNTELVEAIQKVLEKDGSLQTIRAQLRRGVIQAMNKEPKPSTALSSSLSTDRGKLMLSLVRDMLEKCGLRESLLVFDAETNSKKPSSKDEEHVESTLHLPSGPSSLLERLIESHIHHIENPRIRHPEAEAKDSAVGSGENSPPKGLSPLDKRPSSLATLESKSLPSPRSPPPLAPLPRVRSLSPKHSPSQEENSGASWEEESAESSHDFDALKRPALSSSLGASGGLAMGTGMGVGIGSGMGKGALGGKGVGLAPLPELKKLPPVQPSPSPVSAANTSAPSRASQVAEEKKTRTPSPSPPQSPSQSPAQSPVAESKQPQQSDEEEEEVAEEVPDEVEDFEQSEESNQSEPKDRRGDEGQGGSGLGVGDSKGVKEVEKKHTEEAKDTDTLAESQESERDAEEGKEREPAERKEEQPEEDEEVEEEVEEEEEAGPEEDDDEEDEQHNQYTYTRGEGAKATQRGGVVVKELEKNGQPEGSGGEGLGRASVQRLGAGSVTRSDWSSMGGHARDEEEEFGEKPARGSAGEQRRGGGLLASLRNRGNASGGAGGVGVGGRQTSPPLQDLDVSSSFAESRGEADVEVSYRSNQEEDEEERAKDQEEDVEDYEEEFEESEDDASSREGGRNKDNGGVVSELVIDHDDEEEEEGTRGGKPRNIDAKPSSGSRDSPQSSTGSNRDQLFAPSSKAPASLTVKKTDDKRRDSESEEEGGGGDEYEEEFEDDDQQPTPRNTAKPDPVVTTANKPLFTSDKSREAFVNDGADSDSAEEIESLPEEMSVGGSEGEDSAEDFNFKASKSNTTKPRQEEGSGMFRQRSGMLPPATSIASNRTGLNFDKLNDFDDEDDQEDEGGFAPSSYLPSGTRNAPAPATTRPAPAVAKEDIPLNVDSEDNSVATEDFSAGGDSHDDEFDMN
eukprot:gene27041-32674_t